MIITDEIFTVEQAAEFARVSPAVIRRWFDEGLKHMPTVSKVSRTGPRREIVRRSELLLFIESREVGARERPAEGSTPTKLLRPQPASGSRHGFMKKKRPI